MHFRRMPATSRSMAVTLQTIEVEEYAVFQSSECIIARPAPRFLSEQSFTEFEEQ